MAKVISSAEFENEVLKSSNVAIVDFFAVWCEPCKMLAPVIDEIGSELSGKVSVFKVDVDQSSDIAMKYEIMGVPTVMVFKDGAPVDKIVGFLPKAVLKGKLEQHVG